MLGRAAISAACRTPRGHRRPARARSSRRRAASAGRRAAAARPRLRRGDARLRRRRVRPRARRRRHRRQLSRARPHARRTPRRSCSSYLVKTMCDGRPPPGKFDLFAVEGGTAAMCYVFGSLVREPGARAAATPSRSGRRSSRRTSRCRGSTTSRFETIEIAQSEMARRAPHLAVPRRGDRQARRPARQGVLRGQPGNPASVAHAPGDAATGIVELVRTKRPDLIILTDDVYGTFVDGFRSLAADLPRNTILVYSYSKHFGCTGWRLGVVVAARGQRDRRGDRARCPRRIAQRCAERYPTLTAEPDALKFIDRMVADSRDVALSPLQ